MSELGNGTGGRRAASASGDGASDPARRRPFSRTSARASRFLTGPPEAVLEVLRSAHSGTQSSHLDSVLEDFRQHWLAIGRRCYPQLANDLEDAVQIALIKLLSRDKLATLHDARRIEPWARSIFVHTVLDLLRSTRRHGRHRTYLGAPEDDPELALRQALSGENPTPEDLTLHRERLVIVARVAFRLEVARVKFVEDLPDKDIAKRHGLTRHGVASQLKRMRKVLRHALGAE